MLTKGMRDVNGQYLEDLKRTVRCISGSGDDVLLARYAAIDGISVIPIEPLMAAGGDNNTYSTAILKEMGFRQRRHQAV
eukprot:13808572-Alexandrium_andersonii.AAC.1